MTTPKTSKPAVKQATRKSTPEKKPRSRPKYMTEAKVTALLEERLAQHNENKVHPQPVVKPGSKTTEFYITAVVALVGGLYASGTISPEGTTSLERIVALVAAALASAGYSVSRGRAKAQPEPKQ